MSPDERQVDRVNLTFPPTFSAPPYLDRPIQNISKQSRKGIKSVETAGRSPKPYMPMLKAADIKVIHNRTSDQYA